ncbi:MAG: hypothetical protein M0P70_04940 [Desulfobulbaceae bacterium]|nr:hypothetical protein [Desulfobulbaceae bacterium]
MTKPTWPYRICLAILLLGLFVLPWTAEASETSMEGYREIAAFELKQLLDSGRKVLMINVLSKIEYDFQHISGSINIPIVQMLTTDRLPPDRQTILVFHCLSER